MKRIISALFLTMLCVGVVQAASDLPAAEKLIAKYVEASGGEDVLTKYDTAHATGTFSMPAMGIEARIEVWQKAPNLTRTNIISDAFGTMSEGFDGEVAWESSMMTGAKVKEGVELAVARRSSKFSPWVEWEEDYQEARTVGSETVDGVNCWLVEMVPHEGGGEPEKIYFAKNSGLIHKTAMLLKSEMGTINVESFPSDYEEVQGVLQPMRSRQVLMGTQEIVLDMETHEFGVEIPAGTFDLPEDVQALVEENK